MEESEGGVKCGSPFPTEMMAVVSLCLFCCQSGIRGELYERLQANLQASRMTKLALAFIKLTVVLWDHGLRMPQYCIKCILTQCKDRQQHCITFFFFTLM